MAAIDDYRWLVSDAAQPWLSLAQDELSLDPTMQVGDVLVKLTSQLRRDLSANQTHLVIEQIDLRARARDKFGCASEMFFTRKGLEQATDEQLAAYKASRFRAEQRLADLCCGIGGDLVAFTSRGKTHGIDHDPATALLATANARVHGFSHECCSVTVQDATEFPVGGTAWHCDPDRRKDGRRATRGELFNPALEQIDKLLTQSNAAAVKLAPATEAPVAWQQNAELEWLSSRGECRQQVAWFGPLARHPGKRAATVFCASGKQSSVVGTADEAVPQVTAVGRYLYEPDAAVLAAKLSAVLCLEHSLAAISPGIAYFTSDIFINDLALDRFEVIDVLPLDRKQLKAYCREHRLGRLEIKKRGVDLSPDRLRKEIAGDGENAATIIVAPMQNQNRAIITRRISR